MTTRAAPACIDSFTGPYRFLSSFAILDVPLWLWDQRWPTSVHAYYAGKTTTPSEFRWIRDAPTPGEAKRRSQQVTGRPDWDEVKRTVMLQVMTAKFSQQPVLRKWLIATGHAPLIDGNSRGDDFWGALPTTNNPVGQLWQAADGTYLAGRNWLGRILMMTRDVLTPEQ